MNKYGLQWERRRQRDHFAWNWKNTGAAQQLKNSSMKNKLFYQCILIQSGGQDTIELSLSTPKHFAHLSPSRCLDGVGATQSCLSGKTTSSINAHSADWNTRIQNI